MSVQLSIDELLRYCAEERDKWRRWLAAHPEGLEAVVQPGGRYPTVGKLIDHAPLFDYGASVRRELEQYVRGLEEEEADQPRTFEVHEQQWSMTPRKLLFHILLHETRHWAQVALAVRVAGLEPPGAHDLFYSRALK
jgi:hypothetical protein